jgi:hypothetical protein
VFNHPSESLIKARKSDTIVQFHRLAGDKIDLRGMDAITGGVDDAFTFIGTDDFSGAAGELRLVYKRIDLLDAFYIQGNVDADAEADFRIVVFTTKLIESDFLL